MTTEVMVLLVVGVVAAALSFAWRHFRPSTRQRRALASAEDTNISQVSEGATVRVSGRVSAREAEPKIAPLSQRPCLAWRLRADVRKHTPESDSFYWQEVLDLCDHVSDLHLEDATAQAKIEPAMPVLSIVLDRTLKVDANAEDLPERSRSLVELILSHGDSGDLHMYGDVRFREGIVTEGTVVSVLGVGRRRVAPGKGYRDVASVVVIEAPSLDQGRMVIGTAAGAAMDEEP